MTRHEIERLQALLNKTGGLLEVDGLLGNATRRAVVDARALAGLPPGDDVDDELLRWLEAAPEPSRLLPTEGVTFIAREEVGSRDFYEARTAFPHWPGEQSGITIGVGYDLRFSADIFEDDWKDKLTNEAMSALRSHLGRPGSRAKAEALSWICVPWTSAWQVFTERSLPQQTARTRSVYDAFDRLPGLCRSTLVSLVFNRGPSVEDDPGSDRRREMRMIRDLLARDDFDKVPEQIRSMRRLWPDVEGLCERREREAVLWEWGLQRG